MPQSPASVDPTASTASTLVPPLFDRVRFVLNETSHPGNVGSAARAIKTMGFGRLVLAAPRAGVEVLRDPEAVALASGADDVLANALVVPDLNTALQGVSWAVALSARSREYGPPNAEPRESAALAVQHAAQGDAVAFLFGSERTGLSNADVERCNALVHIPANPLYSSLNLSQAVQLIAYEVRMACLARERGELRGDGIDAGTGDAAAASAPATHESLATRDDVEGMLAHLERALVDLDFLDPDNPKKLMTRLRRLFAKSHLEREEVNILRGVAKHILERKIRR
jgi:tRNA/rRNA methyltransferase